MLVNARVIHKYIAGRSLIECNKESSFSHVVQLMTPAWIVKSHSLGKFLNR